ncbi:MAG: J domain-containing protein [PVC group bacterium]|nr:J domain-containing protein [PVC group bacterium]
MRKKDYYDILGVKDSASSQQIKSAYRKLAMKYHPDRVPEPEKKNAEEKFKEIAEAYYVLNDFNRRREYSLYREKTKKTVYRQEDVEEFFRNAGFNMDDIMQYANAQPEYSQGSNWSKNISLIVAGVCCVGLYIIGQKCMMGLPVFLPLILGMGCIWFSDAMSGWDGVFSQSGTVPGCVFSFFGWILLLVQMLVLIMMADQLKLWPYV